MKKYIIGGLGCLFTLGILFRLPLSVEAEDNVLLRPDGNKAFVVLETNDMRNEEGKIKDEIVSLQISFQIETKAGDSQKNQIAFDFDKSITSAVRQYRYHKDTGILNVYVAGKEDLCQTEQLSLGSIVLSSDQENGSAASVKIVDQSLITVNKAFDKQAAMLGSGTLDAKADLIVGNGGEVPKPPEDTGTEDNGTEENPPSDKEDNQNPPSDDGDNNNGGASGGDNSGESSENRRPSKGSGSHSSSNSQSVASSADTSLGSTLRGLLNRRPKTVQSVASVATDDTAEDEVLTLEEDPTEPLPEEDPIEEPETEDEDESFFSDEEEVVEKAVDVGLVAGVVAALVVVILIVLEYRRQLLRHRHKNKK